MKRIIILALALLACGGAFAQYVGYDTGYTGVARGASYQAGGGSAGWDTVKHVYTMAAGIDHTFDSYDAAVAAADSVYLLTHADRQFAYAMPDTNHVGASRPSQWVNDANNHDRLYFNASGGASPFLALTDSSGTAPNVRPLLLHFNPDIPAGSTIVSAKLHFRTIGWTTTTTDSLIAVLMDKESDGQWWQFKGLFDSTQRQFSTDIADYMAKCGYTNQVQKYDATPNYGYTDDTAHPWVPALSERDRYWDWGSVFDWSPTGARSSYSGEMAADFTDCAQAIANGATNNGIAFFLAKRNAHANDAWNFFEPRVGNAAEAHRPWIEIKYLTKRYAPLLPNGKKFAFVFQTDDAVQAFNDSLVAEFAGRGGKYTIFAVKRYTDISATAADTAKLIEWHDAGMEIGHHSLNHWPRGNKYLNVFAIQDTAHASLDSLRIEMNPAWLDDYADTMGRSDLRESPRWARAMAMPGNLWNPFTVYVGAEKGVTALRVGSTSILGPLTYSPANLRPAATDSAVTGPISERARVPRNAMLFANTVLINGIVGVKGNVGADPDSVEYNAKKLANQILAQDRYVLGIYTHDFKTGPYSGDGAEMSEIRAMVKAIEDAGGMYMTISEYTDWLRANSSAVGTPIGYAQPDTFRFDAADAVWYRPHGIDNRWIRGVK